MSQRYRDEISIFGSRAYSWDATLRHVRPAPRLGLFESERLETTPGPEHRPGRPLRSFRYCIVIKQREGRPTMLLRRLTSSLTPHQATTAAKFGKPLAPQARSARYTKIRHLMSR